MSKSSNSFDLNTFMSTFPNILENESLRKPQINSYIELRQHFIDNNSKDHALVVLPTGVGKTGLIGIAPYGISSGRVLVIAPRVPIKDNLIKSLDPLNPDNFWIKRGVFDSPIFLPSVCEYSSKLPKEVLDISNLVILNAQKLQSRLESSPLKFLPPDYFDLIIIDEAHHSTAKTWCETIDHFSDAKVIKLTGTPFRTDGEKIEGQLIYNYKLGMAMANNYIKSLENISYVPDKLFLTMDNNEDQKYSIDEIYSMGLKDEDWISRSVAFSKECSRKVVDNSIDLLEKKKSNSKIPHKIIAVACSIPHAKQIKALYEQSGKKVALIHSDLDATVKDNIFSDINNNRVEVVVNVAMLGEGYDHPYLSIAAIFRPFRAELPYIQFIGRILRYIDDDATPYDNIGHIVSHKHLSLDSLWKKYKKEIDTKDIIELIESESTNKPYIKDTQPESSDNNVISIGSAFESGEGETIKDPYLDTELFKKVRQQEAEDSKKVAELITLLDITQDQAVAMVKSSNSDSKLKRPDQLYLYTKSSLDNKIKYEIIPELVVEFNIDKDSKSLATTLPFFKKYEYKWIVPRAKDNLALLAMYFNDYLRREIGRSRNQWTTEDFDLAYKKLDSMVKYIHDFLKN